MTDLLLETPRQEPTISRRMIIWTVIVGIIALGGLAGSIYALKKTQAFVKERKPAAAEAVTNPTPLQ